MDGELQLKPGSKSAEQAEPIVSKKAKPEQAPVAVDREEYRRVRFHEKRHDYEEDRVKLSCNGEQVVVARGVEIVLPMRYLEIARHACYPKFTQVPGQDRKISTPIAVFPFDDLGPAESKDFYRMKKEGTDKIRKEIEPKPV